MANNKLVYTSGTTGVSSDIITDASLSAAITNVEIACNAYANNADTIIQANINAAIDGAIAEAMVAVLPTLPSEVKVLTQKQFIKIENPNNPLEYVVLTLRDQSYTDALVAACNALTLQEIANAQTILNQIVTASATNVLVDAKLYTDQQIQALQTILTSTYATIVYVDTKLEALEQQIQTIEVASHTFETWLNYWARADAYLDELYDTVDEEYYRKMGWIT